MAYFDGSAYLFGKLWFGYDEEQINSAIDVDKLNISGEPCWANSKCGRPACVLHLKHIFCDLSHLISQSNRVSLLKFGIS